MIKCKDCGAPADPECTERFVDLGEPDLHFCKPCHERSMLLLNSIIEAIKQGKTTIEDVEAAMNKVVAENPPN